MISKYKTQYMTCTSLVVGLPTIYWCQVVGYSAVVPRYVCPPPPQYFHWGGGGANDFFMRIKNYCNTISPKLMSELLILLCLHLVAETLQVFTEII